MAAYAYLRKSSVRDPKHELSWEMQEAEVRTLAARFGDDNGHLTILSDWDKSGRLGPDKRPGYRALLEAVESGTATSVYSYSLSRLGRSVAELARLIDLCDRQHVAVRLVADNIDTTTASGRLLANVLGSVAQFEAEVAGERVRASVAVRRARGERVGAAPFGEGDGDAEAAVLAAFAEAHSFSGAARLLNERGIAPRNSTRGWWPSSVAVVVKRLDPGATVRQRAKGARAGGTGYILSRLLACPTCGTRLTGFSDREGKRVRYACRLGSVRPHPRVSVTESHILPAIMAEAARTERLDPEYEVAGDEDARERLEAKRLRWQEMYADGMTTKAELAVALADIDRDVEALDARRSIIAVPALDWTWPPRQLNRILATLWNAITLDPKTFQPVGFEWRWPPEYLT